MTGGATSSPATASPATAPRANLAKSEPALMVSGVGAVVSYLGAALVSHGVLGSAEMSSAEQTIVPAVSAGLVMLLGLITRRLVKPARWLERELARLDDLAGHASPASPLSDQDWSRMSEMLRAELSAITTDTAARPNPGRSAS